MNSTYYVALQEESGTVQRLLWGKAQPGFHALGTAGEYDTKLT